MADNNATASKGQGERDVSDQEKALAGTWEKKIQAAKKKQKDDKTCSSENLKVLREYVNGKQHDDGSAGLVRTNLIFSTIATVLPSVYAKNPDISVTPTEAVEEGQYKAIKKFCRTLEIVLRRLFVKEGKLKKRMKSSVRSAMTTSIGWLKVIYQHDFGKDPAVLNRIADIQDNLKRVGYLTTSIEEDGAGDTDAKKAELEQQLKALESQVEIVVAEGLVIDRILTEDILILDDSIKDFDSYVQARAIAHRVWYTKESYAETFGHELPKAAVTYKLPSDDKKKDGGGAQEWVAVYEIWDRISQTIYTKTEGPDEWCREPYQPEMLGERWYPFFALGFNPVDGQFEPLSDVALLKELQDEYNTTRTNFAEHRKENLPVRVFRKGGNLTEGDVRALSERKANEFVGIEGDPSVPLEHDIQVFDNPVIDPSTYDVTPIRNDMDVVAGISDASRSNLIQAKTATEAEIMKEGMMSRTGERQDTIEDLMQEMTQYAAEIALQRLTPQQVQRIAGPGATWPQLAKEEIFNLVTIEIRAGSTGKPNKTRERDQWIQFMPVFKDMVTEIVELRAKGQPDMANALIEMLKETLRRFDERLDLDTFVPGQNGDDQLQEMSMQMQQMMQKVQQLEQENAQLKPLADQNQTKLTIADKQIAAEREGRTHEVMMSDRAQRLKAVEQPPAAAPAPAPPAEPPAPMPAHPPVIVNVHKDGKVETPVEPAPVDPNAPPVLSADTIALQQTVQQFAQIMQSALKEFADVVTADRVPIRGKDGKIERMRTERMQ